MYTWTKYHVQDSEESIFWYDPYIRIITEMYRKTFLPDIGTWRKTLIPTYEIIKKMYKIILVGF